MTAGSVVLALGVSGAFALQASGFADGPEKMVLFADRPLPTNVPQTPEQVEKSRAEGRTLPQPELLQPSLDRGLRSFRPAYGKTKLRGDVKCASSDVLPGLARAWAAKVEQYYPKVNVSVSPPYASSLGAIELIKGVFVSRELKQTDVSTFRDAFGYESLSFDQLDRILSTTNSRGGTPIRTWGDFGLTGEWADEPIHIVGIQPGTASRSSCASTSWTPNGKRGEWRGETSPDEDVTFHKTVFDVAGDIARDISAPRRVRAAPFATRQQLSSDSSQRGDVRPDTASPTRRPWEGHHG